MHGACGGVGLSIPVAPLMDTISPFIETTIKGVPFAPETGACQALQSHGQDEDEDQRQVTSFHCMIDLPTGK